MNQKKPIMTPPSWSYLELLPYTIGALLYSPAIHSSIASAILSGHYGKNYSLALCLEDSISDALMDTAEEQLVLTFQELYQSSLSNSDVWIPKIFIRVKNPEQVLRVFSKIEPYANLLTGFIFPKYNLSCANSYIKYLEKVNQVCNHTIYMMPIMESSDLISPASRSTTLLEIKQQLSDFSHLVLNIRVGGNDFCKEFGIRRNCTQTIYDIAVIQSILSDIIATFSRDYIVSAPVWEYFSGNTTDWSDGLYREIKLDLLNGFIGKTVIHPNQIPIVHSALKVSKIDYEDALRIHSYDDSLIQVEKSLDGSRMNEIKTHGKWAEKILKLAQIYGINE